MLQCPRDISVAGERFHELGGDPGVQRVLPRQPAQPADRRAVIVAGDGAFGELMQEVGELVGQGGATVIHPPLKGLGAGKVEPLEKGAPEQLCPLLQVAGGAGIPELTDIRGGKFGVQPEVLDPGNDLLRPQIPPQRIERLGQGPASPLVIGLGPQESEQRIPGDPEFASLRQQREQRQAARLPRRSRHRPTVVGHE